jgi:hypothetical protein
MKARASAPRLDRDTEATATINEPNRAAAKANTISRAALSRAHVGTFPASLPARRVSSGHSCGVVICGFSALAERFSRH